ncbi:MAG TPA: CHAT domain-containing protein [Candidatus Sulfotelmatobacter sp.]|nr:CHAT domain-containing protein [Candidatus Sulfotelmatobacter sp.]
MGEIEQEVVESLARQAEELRKKVNSVAPDEGAALAVFGDAATVSLWAAAAGEDIDQLDAIIDQGYYVMIAAGRNPVRLFPPARTLLDTMTFCAWSHLERFKFRLDVFDLDEAHRYATDALTLGQEKGLPDATAIRAETVIACVAFLRFQLGGKPTLLAEAVERLEHSISLQPDVTAMVALANCLRHRAEVVGCDHALDDLNHAAALLRNVVDPETELSRIPVYPVLRAQWLAELGLVHLSAARLFKSARELQAAKELCRAAIEEWPSSAPARFAFALAEDTQAAYLDVLHLRNRNAWIALPAAEALTRVAVASGRPEDAVRPSKFVWDILQQAIDNQIEDAYKMLWLPRLARATAVAAPIHASAGQVGQAVEFVENIRTRVLQERFPDEERELFELSAAGHRDLSAPIRQALNLLREREGSPLSRARARNELYSYVGRVRQIPGFSAFRASPKVPAISAIIDAPAIYLVPGEPAGVALVVLPNGTPPTSVPLLGCPLSPPAPVERFRRAAFAGDLPAGARRAAIDSVCNWAWDALYQPLGDVLAPYAHVYVIGVSYLALVPFHAARTSVNGAWHYASEKVELRYVPSARALIASKKRQVPEIEPKFMVIPQPARAGSDLDGARSEVQQVAGYFPQPVILPQEEINSQGIRQAIGSVGWLHAACHGVADAEDPLASGLVLSEGERFSLRDLFTANEGHLLLTVLSACQTNVPDVRLPDEATSLAAGLLLGGCRAVIASAWQVPDTATSALMRLFYHRWRHEHDEISSALHNAQLAFAAGHIPGDEWKKEWAEPYFWAGFSYLGP